MPTLFLFSNLLQCMEANFKKPMNYINSTAVSNLECTKACPSICLFICPCAKLCGIHGKHSRMHANNDIAYKLARKIENDPNCSKNTHTTPTRLHNKNCDHFRFPCFLIIAHKAQHIHHINFHTYCKNRKIEARPSNIITYENGIRSLSHFQESGEEYKRFGPYRIQFSYLFSFMYTVQEIPNRSSVYAVFNKFLSIQTNCHHTVSLV